MSSKIKLYIGLLVLVVVLTGGGIWIWSLSHPTTVDAPEGTQYSYLIPDSTPLISANISHIMKGEFNMLSIYADGKIIYIEEKGLRMPSPEHPPTRTWKAGQLRGSELDSLLEFIKNSGFEKLENRYQFPGEPIEGGPTGGFRMGDMILAISVNSESLSKTVTASGYLTPDQGLTYPDIPYPLNEIYQRLKQIANNQTQVVASETTKSSLSWQ